MYNRLSYIASQFHSYKHTKSNIVSSLVSVSSEWNSRFDLIGILHRNMYICAHDDHPHNPLSFIGVLVSGPVGSMVRYLASFGLGLHRWSLSSFFHPQLVLMALPSTALGSIDP
jgi:hypothetical protein